MDDSRPTVLIFKKDLMAYSETFIAEQARGLTRYRPVFVAFRRVESGIGLIAGMDRILLDEGGWRRIGLRSGCLAAGWRRRLDAVGPVLIHAQFGTSGVAAMPIARALGVPLICTFQGFDITARPSAAYRKGRHRLYREAAAILAVSDHLREKLIADGCPEWKTETLHTGVRIERFDRARNPDQYPLIGYAGRLVEKKGIRYLIAVVPPLLERLPELRVELIGTGAMEPEVRGLAERYPGRVLFRGAGSHDDVADLFSRSWIFLGPSVVASSGDSEGLPNVHVEAQAAGAVVVAFDSDGVREAVVHGETGLLVPERDAAGLEEACFQVLTDPALRERLSLAGRDQVRRKFDLLRQCQRLEARYDAVIAGREAGAMVDLPG